MNVLAERNRFCQRAQHGGESTAQYAAALCELIITCEFGLLAEDIGDQIVEKVNNTRIRECLTDVGDTSARQHTQDAITDDSDKRTKAADKICYRRGTLNTLKVLPNALLNQPLAESVVNMDIFRESAEVNCVRQGEGSVI